jgi:large subunit ribosomal protein L21
LLASLYIYNVKLLPLPMRDMGDTRFMKRVYAGSRSVNTQSAYAIIAAGGKQHRVKVGQRFKFELMPGEPGESVEFGNVMLVANGENVQVGAPYLPNSKVLATIVQHGRGEKIRIFKMRRRKTYRRTQGHRQHFTEVEITQI